MGLSFEKKKGVERKGGGGVKGGKEVGRKQKEITCGCSCKFHHLDRGGSL